MTPPSLVLPLDEDTRESIDGIKLQKKHASKHRNPVEKIREGRININWGRSPKWVDGPLKIGTATLISERRQEGFLEQDFNNSCII